MGAAVAAAAGCSVLKRRGLREGIRRCGWMVNSLLYDICFLNGSIVLRLHAHGLSYRGIGTFLQQQALHFPCHIVLDHKPQP